MSEMSWCRLAPVLPRARIESGPEPRYFLRAHDPVDPVACPIRPKSIALLSRAKVGTGRCPSRLRPRPRTPHHARRSMHVRADTIGIDPCGASTLRPRTILAHLRRHGRQHHHPNQTMGACRRHPSASFFGVCGFSRPRNFCMRARWGMWAGGSPRESARASTSSGAVPSFLSACFCVFSSTLSCSPSRSPSPRHPQVRVDDADAKGHHYVVGPLGRLWRPV